MQTQTKKTWRKKTTDNYSWISSCSLRTPKFSTTQCTTSPPKSIQRHDTIRPAIQTNPLQLRTLLSNNQVEEQISSSAPRQWYKNGSTCANNSLGQPSGFKSLEASCRKNICETASGSLQSSNHLFSAASLCPISLQTNLIRNERGADRDAFHSDNDDGAALLAHRSTISSRMADDSVVCA